MKGISHSINRDGKLVKGNGFKAPEPTIAMHNPSIWMHSVDRTDAATPVQGFVLFGCVFFAVVVILIFVR